MASLLLLFLCAITIHGQEDPPKDTVVFNLVVETSTLATNQIDNSVSRYPAVADYDNLNYFRSRISILSDETLLVGAINKLYHVSKDLSTTIASVTWNATDPDICTLAFNDTNFLCTNHIRIHELQPDGNTVLVCGTNAIQPRCRLHNLASLTPIDGTIITPQSGLVPFRPDFKGLTINNAFPGGILAVNYLDAAQEDLGISYQFLNVSGGMIDNTIQYRSIQGIEEWLKIPAAFADYYADSYSSDDSLSFYFIFLTENSVEISGTVNEIIYSRVIRICKNDPGVGEIRGSADYFKTYVKAYIYCEKPAPGGTNSVPGSTSYHYNVIQKVSLVYNSTYRVGVPRRDRIVYGLFTGPTYGPPTSAICVYGADMSGTKDRGIFTIFSEEYRNLRPGQTSACSSNNIPNDNPFTCDPATHADSRPMPEFDVLMSPAVSQLTTDPLVELNGITATTIYTTQALVCNSTVSQCSSVNDLVDIDVMLVGTNSGKVLKIVMTYNGTDHVPLISEELSLADSLSIQNMEPQFVDGEFDHLLLSTDSYIYRLPPQRCNRFDTCVDCVKARDPHCFWNQHADPSQRGCKVLQNRGMYDPQTWYQDINHGNVTQWTDCGGAVSNFTITSDVVCDSGSRRVDIIITPENNENTFVVAVNIERLSSCGTGASSSLPQSVTVPGQVTTHTYGMNSLQPYTWYRVNVTANSIMRTVSFRTCGDVPDTPGISAIFETNDGILVYPTIGCLNDDITNYTITVSYIFLPCTTNTEQIGTMSLPGASGNIFNITGLGSYTTVNNVAVTVQNSFGSNMFISNQAPQTIEQTTTNSMVTTFSVMPTSSSLNVSWNEPDDNDVCGTLTGYSVYVDSTKMTNCIEPRFYFITGLRSFTQYNVSVTVCTIVGEGPVATVPSGMTMTSPGTPTRVQSITATTTTSSVAFSWNAPQFNGGPGTYEVDYTCHGRGNPVSNTVSSISTTGYTISDINCYEADCYARVRASNAAGNMGLYSSEFRGSTSCPTMLPSSASVATSDITIETMTRNSISVNWTVPSDYCGPKRTFMATVTPQGSSTPLCDVSTSQNFINCTGLQFSQLYNVRIVTMITCNGGVSVTSDTSVSPMSYTHPCFITDPPNNVAFARSGSMALTWNPVTNCGNVMYNVFWSCGGSGQTGSTSQTSFMLNITDPASFTYCLGQVQACNDQGCGRISNSVSVLIPLQPPPTVSITGAVNGTTVLIMFSIAEPTDLGDLRYTLYRRRINPNPTVTFMPIFVNVSYNFSNVLIDNEPGEQETYEYQLEIRNSRGVSPRSNTISETTTQEPPPGSPMDITATQTDEQLVVEWTAPLSSSPLRYTVEYDTVPPSVSGSLFAQEDIELLSLRIPVNELVFDRACSVRVRARDQRTGFYGAWSYARTCYVSTTVPPGSPSIDLTYIHPLFELKWDPPADSNGFILNYTVEVMNITTEDSDCDLCNNQDTYDYNYLLKPDSTIYFEVVNVSASTCFCAAVTARNGAGASSRVVASQFYKYEPMIVIPPDVGSRTDNNGGGEAAPIVAIVLGVVLIIVALVTLVLAVVFFKLYNSRMKQAVPSESRKSLNSY